MSLRPLVAAVVLLAAPGSAVAAPAPVDPGVVEHTVESVRLTRDGVVERDERVERWVARDRAKVVYRDPATNEITAGCVGTRTYVRCFGGLDPYAESGAAVEGSTFLPSWREQGQSIRRAVSQKWLAPRGAAKHRGIAARKLIAGPRATGDPGETTVLAEQRTWSVLYRETRSKATDGWLVSVEDVLVRERLRRADVDLALRAPAGARIRGGKLR